MDRKPDFTDVVSAIARFIERADAEITGQNPNENISIFSEKRKEESNGN